MNNLWRIITLFVLPGMVVGGNTIAAFLCQFLAKGPWKNANRNMVAATEQLNAQYWFGSVIKRSNLTTAIFAAAVIAFLLWYVMERTSKGYETNIVLTAS